MGGTLGLRARWWPSARGTYTHSDEHLETHNNALLNLHPAPSSLLLTLLSFSIPLTQHSQITLIVLFMVCLPAGRQAPERQGA